MQRQVRPPLLDDYPGELETHPATGPFDGLTEPQWAVSGLLTGPIEAVGTAARESVRMRQHTGLLSRLTDAQAVAGTSGRLIASSVRQRAVNKRILQAIITLATGTIAVRALGVFNQTVISAHFGAGVAMDAYFATLALPVLLTNLVVSALQSSTVPVYVRLTKEGRDREASRVLSTVLNVVLLLVLAVTALTLVFPAAAVRVMAPGASDATITVGAALAPYLFPILMLNTIVGFLTGISNATRRFGFPAFGAMFVPIGIFFGTVVLGNLYGIGALGIGLLGGTIGQFVLMLALSRRLQLHYRPVFDFTLPEVWTALKQLWPALVGAGIGQANPVIDQVIASALGSGNISVLNYALKVISIPITVIFVANSQAVYPYFSSQAAARDFKSLKATLGLFAWIISLVTAGMALMLAVFAGPVVHILFRRGAFSEQDAILTAATLIGFSVGLVPMALEYMLMRAFNALQRNDLLLKVSVYTMVTNAALDIVFARFFGLPGIALATSVDYLLTAILLMALLRGIIGPLGLFRPPPQLTQLLLLAPLRANKRPAPAIAWLRFEPIGASFWRGVRNLALVLVTLAVLAAVSMQSSVQGLRAGIGMVLAFFFVRSPYLLLLTWAGLGAYYSVYVSGHSIGYILALGSIPTFALLFWQERRAGRRWPFALWTYGVFLWWVVLGINLSPLSHAQFGIDVLGFIDYAAVMVLAISQLTTRERFEQFVTVVLITSAVLACLGVLQYVFRFGGFQVPGARIVYRVGGVWGWSNSFGFFLILIAPLALYRFLTSPRNRLFVWGFVLALIGSALLLTFVRTAYLTFAVLVMVSAAFLSSRLRLLLLRGMAAGLALLIILILIPGLGVRDRLFGDNLLTLNSRTAGWQVLLAHMDLMAPFGKGLFASLALLARVRPDEVLAPHTVYLQVLYDHGIGGLLLLVVTLALLILGAARRARRTSGNARILASLVTGGLVAASLYVAVDNTFWVYGLGTYFWLLAALPYAPVFDNPRYARRVKLPPMATLGMPVTQYTAPQSSASEAFRPAPDGAVLMPSTTSIYIWQKDRTP